MSKITRDDVLKLADLARLDVSDDDVAHYQNELTEIFHYIDSLAGLDLSSYEPTAQVTGLTNATRPDVVTEQPASPKSLLKNAPSVQDNHFKVHRMIG